MAVRDDVCARGVELGVVEDEMRAEAGVDVLRLEPDGLRAVAGPARQVAHGAVLTGRWRQSGHQELSGRVTLGKTTKLSNL